MKIAAVVLLFFSINTYAQSISCLSKLLPYNRFSGTHILLKQEWTDNKETLDAETAINSLKYLLSNKLYCTENEVVTTVEPVCDLLIKDMPQSNTCFLSTNLGHFHITRDSAKNINFVFTKDKSSTDDHSLKN